VSIMRAFRSATGSGARRLFTFRRALRWWNSGPWQRTRAWPEVRDDYAGTVADYTYRAQSDGHRRAPGGAARRRGEEGTVLRRLPAGSDERRGRCSAAALSEDEIAVGSPAVRENLRPV